MAENPFLARAIYAFHATLEGELSLEAGDVILVTKTEERFWFYGRIGQNSGRFPQSSVTRIQPPSIHSCHKYFASLADFTGEQPGDLSFRRGEILIGTQPVDSNWWRGRNEQGIEGIFPLSFVWAVELRNVESGSQTHPPSHTRRNTNAVIHARVIQDLIAQLPDELNLHKGDIVTITGETDDAWYRGEHQGRRGIFPKGFVSITETAEISDAAAPVTNGYSSKKTNIQPYAIVKYDYQAQYADELTLKVGQVIYISSHVNTDWLHGECESRRGIFPKSFVDIVVDSEPVGSPQMIDNIIERNLIELSFSDVPAKASTRSSLPPKLDFSRIQLPPVPPRKQSVPTINPPSLEVPVLQQPLPSDPLFTELRDAVTVTCGNQSTWKDDTEVTGLSSKHYIRPAPPPPDSQPKVMPVRPAPPVPALYGNEEKVEGRRQRAQREQRHRDEEEELRNVELRKKKKEQRENVVSELIVTEREFARDLKLTYEVFHLYEPQYLLAKGIDGTALFGNILEVIHLSEDLADKLFHSSKDKGQSDAVAVGQCFLQLESEFGRVYETYCMNYEDAQALLEKYESNPETMKLFNEGLEVLRQKIACFNMGSVIIKPVQRILKYPLILGELKKSMDDENQRDENLEKALAVMTQIATQINESKRKKEIIQKYLANNADGTIGRKLGRLSLHSMAKKSSRLGMILKSSLGIAPLTKDSVFESVELRFNDVVQAVQSALRDTTALCDQLRSMLQLQLSVAEAFASFYAEKSRDSLVDQFRTAQRTILVQHWSTFDSYIIQHVRGPLTALVEAFQGPVLLVQKRRDKLLDFNIATEKLNRNRDPSQNRILQEEENVARNTYVALNGQLLEELPILIEHAYNIYKRSVSSFVYARKLLVGRATKELLELADVTTIPQVTCSRGEILEDFQAAHAEAVESLSVVSFVSKNLRSSVASSGSEATSSPKNGRRKSSAKSPFSDGSITVQSRETVSLLKSKYAAEDLFMVTGRCDTKEALDLAANPGLLVAVIKREDPMGRTDRWLVDAGDVRGFIPAKHLAPASTTSASPANPVRVMNSPNTPVAPCLEPTRKKILEDDTISASNGDHLYDAPPSYEEASEMAATPREILAREELSYNGNATYEEIKDESPLYVDIDEFAAAAKEFSVTEIYFAAYSFDARSELEISIGEGEAVRIVRKCDEGGNREWWLVENDSGEQGYVPTAYLKPL